MFAIPPPPPETAIVVEQSDDCLRITFPPVGWQPMCGALLFFAFGGLFCVAMAGAVGWIWFHQPAAVWFVILFLAVDCFIGSACFWGAVSGIRAACRASHVTASNDSLSIVAGRGWSSNRLHWRRNEVRSFDADVCGLWVLGERREDHLIAERSLADNRWLADALGTAWGLPSQEPKRPNELDVYVHLGDEDGKPKPIGYVRSFKPEYPSAARLRVAPGELTIRLLLHRATPLRYVLDPGWFFVGSRVWFRLALGRGIPVRPSALTWTERDGKCCLKIEPTLDEIDRVWIWSDEPAALQCKVAEIVQVGAPVMADRTESR